MHHKIHWLAAVCLALLLLCACSDDGDSTNPDGDTADGDITDGDGDSSADGDGDAEATTPRLQVQVLSGLSPNFNFSDETNFFNFPYPNDYFLADDGHIRLPGFPTNKSSLVETFVEEAERLLDGFGNNSPVFWTFPEAIDTDSLPVNLAESVDSQSALLLVNIDPDSEQYGEFTPLQWHYTSQANDYEPANLLAVAPADGFPLMGATTYAMILTDKLLDLQGNSLGRPERMATLLQGLGQAELDLAYTPLVDWLVEHAESLPVERVRAATVFTTLDPTAELKAIYDYLKAEYPNGAVTGELVDCEYIGTEGNYLRFHGHYRAPNFQQGEVPYAAEGGNILFDENGDPIVQKMEDLRFVITVPTDAQMPANGWPLVEVSHGTGGSATGFVGTGEFSRSRALAEMGLAAIGIDQPLHGTRSNVTDDDLLSLYTFNFLNVESGRSVFRQAAIDTIALTRFIRAGKLQLSANTCTNWPASLSAPTFDPDNLLFIGHSQGGMSGALAAAVEDDVKGWMLSGAGGRMAVTIIEREDPDILEMVSSFISLDREDAHIHHPLVALVQWLTEITDMINYAPYWEERPFNGHARNVMLTNGFLDTMTPKRTAAALATSGRLPQIEPVSETLPGLELLGMTSYSRPASNTVTGPDDKQATAGFCQYPDDGHFAIFHNQDALEMYQEFLRSVAYDDKGVLGYE